MSNPDPASHHVEQQSFAAATQDKQFIAKHQPVICTKKADIASDDESSSCYTSDFFYPRDDSLVVKGCG